MAVLYAGGGATKQASSLLDLTVAEILRFAELAESLADNWPGKSGNPLQAVWDPNPLGFCGPAASLLPLLLVRGARPLFQCYGCKREVTRTCANMRLIHGGKAWTKPRQNHITDEST